MYYMGIDHHKQSSHLTVLDHSGQVLKAEAVRNRRLDVEEFIRDVRKELKAVIEAGRSSYTMVETLEELGVEVVIAHPFHIKAIASAQIKTDKRDSKILAQLLRMDMIPEVYRRSPSNREAQRVLRHRLFYVRMQTRLKNKIRAHLSHQGEDVRQMVEMQDKLFNKNGIKLLQQLALENQDQDLLSSMLDTLVHIQEKIRESDELVREIYRNSKIAQRLRSIPGLGEFFSVVVAIELADINRFVSVSKLHSYAGLIPSTKASGQRKHHGRIVRQGNKWLRWALVEAVWPAITADFYFRAHYQKLSRKKGSNPAKVATARRLLTIVYRVWKEDRDYVRHKNQSAAFIRN
jgi:transposase